MRPSDFPQDTALGRRLSQTRFSRYLPEPELKLVESSPTAKDKDARHHQPQSTFTENSSKRMLSVHRSHSSDPKIRIPHTRTHAYGQQLTPIPGSDASVPPSPSRKKSTQSSINLNGNLTAPVSESPNKYLAEPDSKQDINPYSRVRTKSSSHLTRRPQQPQSLNAAIERIAISISDSGHGTSLKSPTSSSAHSSHIEHKSSMVSIEPSTPTKGTGRRAPLGVSKYISPPTVGGKIISSPILNHGEHSPARAVISLTL